MIYKKEANFPYPVLSNQSAYYEKNLFELDIDLSDDSDQFTFEITKEIESEFIKQLIEMKQAQYVLVVQSRDNKFYPLKRKQKEVKISKSRISLNDRITIQLLIKANQGISFENNHDLMPFYDEVKQDITVPKNGILAYSNTVMFDGKSKKPLSLFERKEDPSLKSDIKIQLDQDTIIIYYKNEDLRFVDASNSGVLNNHYIYMGLQKALYRFVQIHEEKESNVVYVDEIDEPVEGLNLKLYNLLRNKKVKQINLDNIDEVIYKISDKVLEKHAKAVKRLYSDGN